MGKYVNVKIPIKFYGEKIDQLVEEGRYSSRADAVKEALRILFKEII